MAIDWLKRYYGKDYLRLNPTIVKEGKKFAVVRIQRSAEKGFSAFGYVLIKKSGSHDISPYQSLFEGLASPMDLTDMLDTLRRKEKDES